VSELKAYSNYEDAIFYEIDRRISEEYDIEEPSDEYDIDSIADEVIGFCNGKYKRKVSEKDFWEIVNEYAI
jgi:hypothetical protein